MTDQASIDTRIYGNPDDIREAANKLYTVYESLDTLSGQFKSKLRTNFYAWDGEAAHSYDDAAVSMGTKVQRLTDRFYSAYAALRAYAQQLDYHYRDMESIREQAKVANLAIVNKYDILPPDPIPEPTIGKCYPESAYGTPPSIGVQVGSPDGKFSHDRQVEIFHELDQQIQAVRDDLEQWVVKHVRSVQEECITLIFVRVVNDGVDGLIRDPWQLLPDTASTLWDTGTAHYASLLKQTASSSTTESAASKQLAAAISDASLGKFKAMPEQRLSAMRGIGEGLSKSATVVGVGTLGYEVVTSDTPAQKAATGGLGLAVGTFVGGVVTDAVIGMAGGAEAGPFGVAAGGIAGTITGFVTGLTTEAHANALYEQIPLEYRDRADAFVSHLPYYMFGGSW